MEQIIFETMESYNEYIERLNQSILPLAESFRTNEVEGALQNCVDLFEGIEWLLSVNAKLNELNFTNEIDIQDFNRILKEINEAIEIKDMYSCADILEYELLEAVQKLKLYELEGA